nr:hypothetical protein CFP56_22293 [Quercus suber]
MWMLQARSPVASIDRTHLDESYSSSSNHAESTIAPETQELVSRESEFPKADHGDNDQANGRKSILSHCTSLPGVPSHALIARLQELTPATVHTSHGPTCNTPHYPPGSAGSSCWSMMTRHREQSIVVMQVIEFSPLTINVASVSVRQRARIVVTKAD